MEGRRAFSVVKARRPSGSVLLGPYPGSLIPSGFGHPGLRGRRPFGTLLVTPTNKLELMGLRPRLD